MDQYLVLSSLLFLLGFLIWLKKDEFSRYGWFVHKKHIVFFVVVSVGNCLYGILYQDFMIFMFRELGLIVLIFLQIYYEEEFAGISKDDSELRNTLEKKYPLLRFETPLMALALLGLIFNLNYSSYPELIFFCLLGHAISVFYCFFIFYHIFCVLRTPKVLSHYNVVKSIRKNGIMSFSTASTALNVCKLCGKGVIGGLGVTWLGPKILYEDPFYRGVWWNELTYFYTGLKSRSSVHMMNANHYLSFYPNDKNLLLYTEGPYKGYIDPLVLQKMANERNVSLLQPFPVEHKVKWPTPNWWPFSKK